MTSLNSETTQWSNFSSKAQPTNGGSKAYWMRFPWGNSENITLSQETSAALPAGTYAVTAEAYSDDATGTATISANGLTKTVRVNSTWDTYTLVFTLASAQKVTVTLSFTNTATGSNVAAFDNVKILDLTSEPTGITLKNELSGTAATLSDFNVWYDDYTLEVEGTASTEITIAADNISYTPEATGNVRFVKKDGIVYVFEGTSYKTAVHSSKADYVYTTALTNDDPETNNLLSNFSFETLGDKLADGKYKLGTPWITNVTEEAGGVRVHNQNASHGSYTLCWRGAGDAKKWYFSQQVTAIKPYKGYKYYLRQTAGGNSYGDFIIGIGNAAGDYSYLSKKQTLGINQNGLKANVLGVSDKIPVGGAYFTVFNPSSAKTTNNENSNDPVTQIDWIGLVGSDDFPISGVSSASYVYGTAYAPATAKASYLAAKAEAETTIADATYTNVTGEERTTLQGYIDAEVEENDAAYNTATENIQTAQATFIAALTHYQALIDAQAAVPDLAYASASASAFKTALATSASDADARVAAMTTNIRAYYESHAMAEGDPTVIDFTSHLTNYNNPSNTTGWYLNNTTGDSKMRIMSNEPYTDADGTASHSYFDSNSWGTAFTSTFTQDVTLPAGTYLLTAKARGNGTTTYKVIAGEESTDITAIGSTGGVFGRGWNDYSVEFTVASEAAVTLGIQMATGSSGNWLSFGNFRLVKMNNTLAEADDYTNLTTAIDNAEKKTLGFEDGEYAPYANADVLAKLVEAKAINQSANNEQSVVQGLTTYLNTASNWTANEGDVDIIYNGTFAIANGNNPKGWTRSNSAWGQQITGLTANTNDVNEGTTTGWYYNTEGAWEYGKDDVYKMPLAADQAYKLTFKYRSHSSGSNNYMKASVLNDSDEGLAEVTFAKNGDATKFITAIAYFTTGVAGNYILSLTQSGNTHMTDVSLEKVASDAIAISENVTVDVSNQTYAAIDLARTIKADTWNTFCVPFDISNSELKTAFGDDVEVAEYSETAVEELSTVSFTKMATPAYTANKPVLLKTPTAGTSYTFTGRTIKTGEAKVVGTGNFDFVGCYDAQTYVTTGNYYLSNNTIFRSTSNEGTFVKGTRAYIKLKDALAANARIGNFSIIDDTTEGIDNVEMESKKNGKIYNLNGQQVSKAQKGLYIQNGKKVVVK